MKTLVTGGGGFIGDFLCKKIYKNGWNVRILDIKEKTNFSKEFDTFNYIQGNILDYSTVLQTIKGNDLIIHLAAKHRFFGISEDEFYQVNVVGTENILKAMSETGINKIVFFSSVAVYGDQNIPTDENTIPKPNTIYGSTKLEAEKLIKKWVSEKTGRCALIIRPTVVFGPKNKGNVYRLIRQIARHLFFPIGMGDNVKSTAYIENMIDVTLFLINKGFDGVEIYNYADEPSISFKEFTNLIYKLLGRPVPKYSLPVNPILNAMVPFEFLLKVLKIDFPITAAISKMNKTTQHNANKVRNAGFRQIYSSEEGLTRTIQWYKSNKREKGYNSYDN
ncbi:MAG: hypothetical protein A3C43_00910 [Candidatus Schekmanbacteria bacterium RIFCSPHIGHO2_02_FULL_38_11]|uniref:3-beta hydroxysteroid dehydrogenase/isomerase domain-containing protein n=1 Tax=Candidatus Schekmanbacteria bacterium RIFCSPLOWO2_12_FULL_38_15 TaxID=1817883 RepID=A0A1F7SPN0_9BACT|nr:MAG: hypothetical protein A2043_07955 [Candidatus Schekmanbacteria bacterium GWA2_38_9]OGL50032.1 MAG: hypothetical protein A3C43_00910 [Candidatus Schekmanbacteria bacterium RIFCSPHIGHO2_02_FULL_38_11]OGL51147.1 MAG: hypothetical protein A3H37_08985 [Candidatus Schekmanbacteria bacterium RIFCSPLOWO2_02_FULL_38_14]OGL55147.1 MAG: hypothetical protein A3G31_02810 [Candidatus Schekmanbacteria bacterium RIFCSPLOWO2_12_FULL_38_15]